MMKYAVFVIWSIVALLATYDGTAATVGFKGSCSPPCYKFDYASYSDRQSIVESDEISHVTLMKIL